jgi:hypothetical protein
MTPKRREREIEEMRNHVEEIASTKFESGMNESTAVHEALLQMGDPIKIGKLIVEDWEKTAMSYRTKIIRGIFGSAIVGTIIEMCIWQDQSFTVKMLTAEHVSQASAYLPLWVLSMGITNIVGLLVPVGVGLFIAKLMPKDSTPETVIPPAVYSGVLFMILRNVLLFEMVRHVPEMARILPGSRVRVLSLDWTTLIILCLSAYASRAASLYKLAKPNSTNWKLRID